MYQSIVLTLLVNTVVLADTPSLNRSTYMGDRGRTGYVDADVPNEPVLKWVYQERHAPRHAWREPNREVQYIDFDYATEVAICGDTVFFGSSADHAVRALDAGSGDEKWTFYTEGPVRFAPVVRAQQVFVTSDDGNLYCLDSETGAELWRFRGGPSDKKLIGNEQMISHWPARSGVLLDGQRLYVTAGMWSRDGVFLFCLEASSGRVIWRNDTSGYHFATLPHSSGFAGVAPQGYLSMNGNRLYVSTGRGAPACFDARNGEFLWYENGHGYKPHQPGGSRVMAWQDWVIMKRRSQHSEENVRYEPRDPAPGAASGLYALNGATGQPAWSLTDKNVVAARGDALILAGQGPVIKVDIHNVLDGYQHYWKDGKHLGHDDNIPDAGVAYTRSGRQKLIPNPAWMSPLPFKQWAADVGRVFVLTCARNTILAGGREQVSAIDFRNGNVLWQKKIEGEARGICVVNGKFLVSSTAGKLYCFGQGEADSTRQISHPFQAPSPGPEFRRTAKDVIETSKIRSGYALLLGVGDGQLLSALIEQSELIVYCLEPDASKAARARKLLDQAGWLGVRAAVHHGSLKEIPYNSYFANLIVWGSPLGSPPEELVASDLYRVLRPCGGVAVEISVGKATNDTRDFLRSGGVPADELSQSTLGVVVRRGKLPGSGEWTHSQANIGRSGSSDDARVGLPMGMLWWGGPGPARVVSRHWRAPVPVFANGILYVQGQHDVYAVDAYNGREMWNRHLENVGRFPPTHRGGNIVADDQGVFCIQGLNCLKLDAQTGQTMQTYTFPLKERHRVAMDSLRADKPASANAANIVWEYLGVINGRLIGTLGNELPEDASSQMPHTDGIQQSKFVFAMDAGTGDLIWERELKRSVSPTAIVADRDAVYLLDRTGGRRYTEARRRGTSLPAMSQLTALDLDSGSVRWEHSDIPIAWKTLMLSQDVVVAYPNPAENQAIDGDKGVGVYSCRDGRMLWSKKTLPGVAETGRGGTMRHSFIVGNNLFLPWAYDLHTGAERLLEKDPLTGEPKPFDVSGKNFCGSIAAAQNLLVYRSASIGFTPIHEDSGSCWLPESRPSCWISAIPAGGMVLAPESYSTCICPYNYKTSLALIPVDRNENWSVYLAGGRRDSRKQRALKPGQNKKGTRKSPRQDASRVTDVRSMFVNFRAPGDQMDQTGRLWLAFPRPVDPKRVYRIQSVPIQTAEPAEGFQFNSDYHAVLGTPTPWLYTSGLTGTRKLAVTLSDGKPARYNVILHFAEPDDAVRPGGRQFDIVIQGETVVSRFDIAAAAGGSNRAVTREFSNVAAAGYMTIEIVRRGKVPPAICAMEIIKQ